MTRSIALVISLATLLLAPTLICAAPAAGRCSKSPSPCDAHAQCVDTGPETYRCTCRAGYSGDGKTCQVSDACVSHPCDPHAACTITGPGTFACSCESGYTGNGKSCQKEK
jgi:EGF domain